MQCVTTKTQMNRKPRRVHTESLCVLQLCEAILNVPNCLHTLFVRGAEKPWIVNTSLIVTDAAKRLIGGVFQRLWWLLMKKPKSHNMESESKFTA